MKLPAIWLFTIPEAASKCESKCPEKLQPAWDTEAAKSKGKHQFSLKFTEKPGFQVARLQRQIQYFSFSPAVERKSVSSGGLLHLVREAKVRLNWSNQLYLIKTSP